MRTTPCLAPLAAGAFLSPDSMTVLEINRRIRIPMRELRFRFVRSAGPGGQNVNKVNTKAVLRWRLGSSQSLPDDVRERFEKKFARRISTRGDLLLSSDRYRSQQRNVDDCLAKLRRMLTAVATAPKKRKRTRPTAASVERRLEEKRRRAKAKQRRRRPVDEG